MRSILIPPLGIGIAVLVILLATAKAAHQSYESIVWATLASVAVLLVLRINLVLRGGSRTSGRGAAQSSDPG